MVLGHVLLEAGVLGALIVGLGGVLTRPLIKMLLGLTGGILLAWTGYALIWRENRKSPADFSESAATGQPAPGGGFRGVNIHPVVAGALVSFSNPYWLLWWTTISLGLIAKALTYGWIGISCFFGGRILADSLGFTLVLMALANGWQYIGSSFYQKLMVGCGFFLLLIAAGFIGEALLTLEWVRDLFEKTIDLFPGKTKLI